MLRSKRGAFVVVFVMMMVIIFPIIIGSIIDFSNIFGISKRLKVSLNAAVKSASSRINWDLVPYGNFYIREDEARSVFLEVLEENMPGVEFVDKGAYFEGERRGQTVRCYINIYNQRHTGTYEVFPDLSEVPSEMGSRVLQVPVDRPTVYGIIIHDYKTMPVLGGRVLSLTQVAAAHLNEIPQHKQPSADYEP